MSFGAMLAPLLGAAGASTAGAAAAGTAATAGAAATAGTAAAATGLSLGTKLAIGGAALGAGGSLLSMVQQQRQAESLNRAANRAAAFDQSQLALRASQEQDAANERKFQARALANRQIGAILAAAGASGAQGLSTGRQVASVGLQSSLELGRIETNLENTLGQLGAQGVGVAARAESRSNSAPRSGFLSGLVGAGTAGLSGASSGLQLGRAIG